MQHATTLPPFLRGRKSLERANGDESVLHQRQRQIHLAEYRERHARYQKGPAVGRPALLVNVLALIPDLEIGGSGFALSLTRRPHDSATTRLPRPEYNSKLCTSRGCKHPREVSTILMLDVLLPG
jgi:hypothetical protein